MANRNGSEDPVALYATNGIDTPDKVKLVIKTLVDNHLFLNVGLNTDTDTCPSHGHGHGIWSVSVSVT
jgi:hypothetical protein